MGTAIRVRWKHAARRLDTAVPLAVLVAMAGRPSKARKGFDATGRLNCHR